MEHELTPESSPRSVHSARGLFMPRFFELSIMSSTETNYEALCLKYVGEEVSPALLLDSIVRKSLYLILADRLRWLLRDPGTDKELTGHCSRIAFSLIAETDQQDIGRRLLKFAYSIVHEDSVDFDVLRDLREELINLSDPEYSKDYCFAQEFYDQRYR